MTAKTNIEIYKTTRDRLKTFGTMGDTYDDVMNTLMDYADGCHAASMFDESEE